MEIVKENKRLRAELKNEKCKVEELKNEIKHKEKQLNDRKKEASTLNKSLENSKLQLKTMNDKYDILKHERDSLNEKITIDKSLWNDKLHSELQEQYIKYKALEAESALKWERMQAQYTSMIGEKEEVIGKKDQLIKETKREVDELKRWLDDAEKSKQEMKGKEEEVSNLEATCKILNSDREKAYLVNKKLEEKIHELAKQNDTNIQTSTSVNNHKVTSRSDENNDQGTSEKRKDGPASEEDFVSAKRNRTDMRNADQQTTECIELTSEHSKNVSETKQNRMKDTNQNQNRHLHQSSSSNQMNVEEDMRTEERTYTRRGFETDNTKCCYACGSSTHEIKDCKKQSNLYARYNGGDRWLNRQGVKWVFEKYGPISTIKIQRNRYGEETKSAMICFENENDAILAIQDMKGRRDWDVMWYEPKGRSNEWNKQTVNRDRNYKAYNEEDERRWNNQTVNRGRDYRTYNNEEDERTPTTRGGKEQVRNERSAVHWTRDKPNFFNEQYYNTNFPKVNNQNNGDGDIRREVFTLKQQMENVLKSVEDMMNLMRYSA